MYYYALLFLQFLPFFFCISLRLHFWTSHFLFSPFYFFLSFSHFSHPYNSTSFSMPLFLPHSVFFCISISFPLPLHSLYLYLLFFYPSLSFLFLFSSSLSLSLFVSLFVSLYLFLCFLSLLSILSFCFLTLSPCPSFYIFPLVSLLFSPPSVSFSLSLLPFLCPSHSCFYLFSLSLWLFLSLVFCIFQMFK